MSSILLEVETLHHGHICLSLFCKLPQNSLPTGKLLDMFWRAEPLTPFTSTRQLGVVDSAGMACGRLWVQLLDGEIFQFFKDYIRQLQIGLTLQLDKTLLDNLVKSKF